MEKDSFDLWWDDLLKEHGGGIGDYYTENRVRRYFADLSEDKRASFLDGLTSVCIERRGGWSIAASVLLDEADINHRRRIYEHLNPLPAVNSNKDLADIETLVKIIAVSPTSDFIDLIETLLFQRPVEPFPHSIPWVMWPHNPDISVRAWVRYFSVVPESEWCNTIIISAFLASADALNALKTKLLEESSGTWSMIKECLAAQINASWITEEERTLVKQVLD